MNIIKITKFIRIILHIILLAITTLVFLFALFSGANPGFKGIIQNIPNVLPWIALYILNIVIFYNEIISGSLIVILIIFLFAFFNIIPQNNWGTFFIFLLPILIIGFAFIILGIINKNKTTRKTDG
jgi:hypothetical protein